MQFVFRTLLAQLKLDISLFECCVLIYSVFLFHHSQPERLKRHTIPVSLKQWDMLVEFMCQFRDCSFLDPIKCFDSMFRGEAFEFTVGAGCFDGSDLSNLLNEIPI